MHDSSALEKLMKSLDDPKNPFQNSPQDKLYCLSTGLDLCCIKNSSECQEDLTHFERPIRKMKIKNFTNDVSKTKLRGKDQTIKEVLCTWDIFQRLHYLGVAQNLDPKSILSHPSTPVPFSLCHIIGAMKRNRKISNDENNKRKFKAPVNKEPLYKNIYIINTMAFLQTLPELPLAFDGVAKVCMLLFTRCCAHSQSLTEKVPQSRTMTGMRVGSTTYT